MAGILFFVNWTTQREPFQGRAQISFSNQLKVYAKIAEDIYDKEGEKGLENFLQNLKLSDQIKDACLARNSEEKCFAATPEISKINQQKSSKNISESKKKVLSEAFSDEIVHFEFVNPDENFVAKRLNLKDGKNLVLLLQFQFLPPPIPLGVDWASRILRILAIILTAGLFCYALTRYLISPVLKLSEATKKLADGDLSIRIESTRRDELGELARDFDEMAEQIESLIGSQKRLTRDISHELRSPLARLNVALELARQKTNAETVPILERIETESKRLNEMISQILTLSRLETRSEKIEKRELNIGKIVEQVVADADFEAAAKDKSVKILRLENCYLQGNERLLRSAVENVIRNAVRYTKPQTSVEISLIKEGNEAVFTAEDNGEGVPENELKELFKPFYRVAEARDRKTGGIGLGLAITEQAVHAHNGKISARNTENGLEIEIRLPLNAAHPQRI